MKYYLSVDERDLLLQTLNDEQRSFLEEKLKRGKQTTFGNILAKSFAQDNTNNKELLKEIKNWSLIEIIDGGKVDSNLRCECGRPLRYQYILENRISNEIKKLGINHLQEHMGIPLHIVKEIIKGISQIDYELDEILYKFHNDWDLNELGINVLHIKQLSLPEDIHQQIQLGLPLLNKQLKTLERIYLKYLDEQELLKRQRKEKLNTPITPETQQKILSKISDVQVPVSFNKLPILQQQFIWKFIQNSQEDFSIIQLSNMLRRFLNIHVDTFSSGKPKNFVEITMFLDTLVHNGYCTLIEKDLVDRFYRKRV